MVLHCRSCQRDLLPALFLLVAFLCFPAGLYAADAAPAPAPSITTAPADDPGPNVSGYFSTRYVYRTATSSDARISDQDVFADLRLDVTRPKDDRYELHFLGSLRSDLDGNQNNSTFYPLEGVADTYGTRATGIVYEAYAVLKGGAEGLAAAARVGRQSGTRDEPVVFDGIAVDVGEERWNLTLYGGAAIHFYEVDKHWGQDTVEGVGFDYRLLPGAGLSIDYLRLKDEQTLYPDDTTQYDRLTSLKAWQRFGSFTSVTEKYRFLDGEPRDLSLKAVTVWQAVDIDASVNYFRQFRTQYEQSNELSLFYKVLGQSVPYQSWDLKVRKFFADRVAVDLGYYKRALLNGADEGPFNKEFQRAFLDVELMNLFLPNLSWTLLAERWESKGRSFDTWGADLSYRIKKNKKETRLSIGTNYSLYKYDYYTELGMREQVRTYYVTGKYPLTSGFSLSGGYEYEHGIENYQTMRLGMRYDF